LTTHDTLTGVGCLLSFFHWCRFLGPANRQQTALRSSSSLPASRGHVAQRELH